MKTKGDTLTMATKEATLTIPAIHCGGCAKSVTRILEALPGVEVTHTEPESKLVDIGFDEVPQAALPGSGEDLDLYAAVNSAGDPLASVVSAAAGDTLTVRFRSPGGRFDGAPPLLVGQVFTGGGPTSPPGFPEIHLDGGPGSLIMFGQVGGSPFGAPGLPSAGVSLQYQIPPGLPSVTLRMQCFVTSFLALNGVFATSDAKEALF